MPDTQQDPVPQMEAAAEANDGSSAPSLAPLGALFARLAEARWASVLGSGRLEFGGSDADVAPGAARATGVAYIEGAAGGWVRAALDLAGGAGSRAQDNKALAAWLDGVGQGLQQLLGAHVELRLVQAGDRPEAGPGVPQGSVMQFSGTFGRRNGRAWLWMEPGLLDRCLQALGDGPEADGAQDAGGALTGAAAMAPEPLQAPADDGPREDDRRPAAFPPLPDGGPGGPAGRIDVLLDVSLQVSVELGRTERQIKEILALVPGSVLELDRLAGDPLDVLINGKRIARAEVVVVDERFAIRITEILAPEDRIAGAG